MYTVQCTVGILTVGGNSLHSAQLIVWDAILFSRLGGLQWSDFRFLKSSEKSIASSFQNIFQIPRSLKTREVIGLARYATLPKKRKVA